MVMVISNKYFLTKSFKVFGKTNSNNIHVFRLLKMYFQDGDELTEEDFDLLQECLVNIDTSPIIETFEWCDDLASELEKLNDVCFFFLVVFYYEYFKCQMLREDNCTEVLLQNEVKKIIIFLQKIRIFFTEAELTII